MEFRDTMTSFGVTVTRARLDKEDVWSPSWYVTSTWNVHTALRYDIGLIFVGVAIVSSIELRCD